MEEKWRECSINKNYEISNKNGWRNKIKGTYPSGHIKKNGYRAVTLGRKYGEKEFHILVAMAFPEICGEWFEKCQVHHKNFNKLDNRPENLVVLTPTEHQKLHSTGENNPRYNDHRKMPNISKALKGKANKPKWVAVIKYSNKGEILKKYDNISQVIEDGYSAGNVCSCCKGKLKTAYGFLWRYAVDN